MIPLFIDLFNIYLSGVKRITQTIAKQVKSQYCEHDSNTRYKNKMWRVENTISFLS